MLHDPSIQQTSNQNLQNVQVHGFAPPSNQEINNDLKEKEKSSNDDKLTRTILKWWHKIAILLLTLNGLLGLWESIKFIIIDLKKLEQQLLLHQVSNNEVNELIVMAVIIAFTTIISFLMALKLKKTTQTTAQIIDLIMATIIIIATKYIRVILLKFDLIASITNIFFK